jgi:hypothetical protein
MSRSPISVCLVAGAALGFFAGCTPLQPPASAAQQLTLTPERAKAALLEMMRTKTGSDIDWFKGDVPDLIAKLKVEEEEDGWYRTGAFRFHPSQAAYTFDVIPQPGVRACAFYYKGTFAFKDDRWVASPPELIATALQGDK